jgi:CDGSH-type Zn-finger protein/uncharacterized Fe-S cluster protein YjdI
MAATSAEQRRMIDVRTYRTACEEVPMSDDVEIVRSKDVEVRFHGHRCIHSRNCVLGRPDVFVPNVEGEWIHPEAATAEEVAELAHNCPSGAIQYQRLDGGRQESPPTVNQVRVLENGPYFFHAELIIEGHADVGYRRVLCRCGASKTKPFCDASHHESGFKATGEANHGEMATLAARNGPVKITPTKNGSLKVEGPLEIVSGTGTTLAKTTKVFLCRCGHSSNKPFCDGTHAKVGFVSE